MTYRLELDLSDLNPHLKSLGSNLKVVAVPSSAEVIQVRSQVNPSEVSSVSEV